MKYTFMQLYVNDFKINIASQNDAQIDTVYEHMQQKCFQLQVSKEKTLEDKNKETKARQHAAYS